MGFFSSIKKFFAGEDADEAELNAARARHGIKLTEKDKAEADTPATEEERFRENYDVWDDLRHFRTQFFFGSWAARKFHPVGEEKVKKQLEELEQKRLQEAEEKERKERGEG